MIQNKNIFIFVSVIIISVIIYFYFESGTSIKEDYPRLVLIYAPCTVNKSFLSPYNSNIKYTPNLREFSKSSYVFFNHRTNAGLSGIAYASLFTGNYSAETGIFTHPKKLPDSTLEIFEVFKKAGFSTFFWNKHPMASSDLNYAQGVDRVIKRKLHLRNDPEFVSILKKLKKNNNYKALIVSNFTVTHSPYSKTNLAEFYRLFPKECETLKLIGMKRFNRLTSIYRKNHHIFSYNFKGALKRFDIDGSDVDNLIKSIEILYKSNIYYLDKIFGNILETIKQFGLFDKTLIVFTADHGELLFRKNFPFKWSHGFNLTPDVLDIPLLIKTVKRSSGPVPISDISRSIDILPTVSSLAGIETPNMSIDGKNIFEYISTCKKVDAYSFSGKLPKPYLEKIRELRFAELYKYFPTDDIRYIWVVLKNRDLSLKLKRDVSGKFKYYYSGASEKNLKILGENISGKFKFSEKVKELLNYRTNIINQDQNWALIRKKKKLIIKEKKKLEKLKSLGYL